MDKVKRIAPGTKVEVDTGSPHHPGEVGDFEFYAEGYEAVVLFVNKGPNRRTLITVDSRYISPVV